MFASKRAQQMLKEKLAEEKLAQEMKYPKGRPAYAEGRWARIERVLYPAVALLSAATWMAFGDRFGVRYVFGVSAVLAFLEFAIFARRYRARRALRRVVARLSKVWVDIQVEKVALDLAPTAVNGVIRVRSEDLAARITEAITPIAAVNAQAVIADRSDVPLPFLVDFTNRLTPTLEKLEPLHRRLFPAPKELISSLPLARLNSLTRFLWSPRTHKLVFEPARADIIHEWNEAEMRGEKWRARYIALVRGPWTMLSHMATRLPLSIKDWLQK